MIRQAQSTCLGTNGELETISNTGIILLFAFLHLLSPSSGKSDSVCVSKGGRFPPFSTDGKPPRKAKKGANDLTLCRVFRKRTCCDVSQTYPASLLIRRLASSGEASQECLHLWETLECAICDPRVGTQRGPLFMCDTFCERVFEACANAYFSVDERKRIIEPCGGNDFVCGKASQWVSNGTELCEASGFGVKKSESLGDGSLCYGGKGSFDAISDAWKSSKGAVSEKEKVDFLWEFNEWLQEMMLKNKVYWVVAFLVFSSALLFVSKRKSNRYRQKLAAIRRTSKKLETLRESQISKAKNG